MSLRLDIVGPGEQATGSILYWDKYIRKLVTDQVEFVVIDKLTGEDITRPVSIGIGSLHRRAGQASSRCST